MSASRGDRHPPSTETTLSPRSEILVAGSARLLDTAVRLGAHRASATGTSARRRATLATVSGKGPYTS